MSELNGKEKEKEANPSKEVVYTSTPQYQPKGYGKIVAIITTVLYFTLIPYLAKLYWPKHLENEKLFNFIFSFTVHEGAFAMLNLAALVIYKLEWNFFERYKVHEFPWPWKENRELWIKQLKRSALVIGFNQFVIVPLILLLSLMKKEHRYRMDWLSLPGPVEIFMQICFFILVDDFLFYWSHRFLHWEAIYPYIHKIHHEYKNTVSIASEHAHFIEFIFGNIVPVNCGPFILGKRVHMLTVGMWLVVRMVKTTEAHMGYQFSWSPVALIPFQIPSDFHNYHHLKFKGNYGSFLKFWDVFCGTVNPGYQKFHNKGFDKID